MVIILSSVSFVNFRTRCAQNGSTVYKGAETQIGLMSIVEDKTIRRAKSK
jgi:hypothetical protein